MDRSDGCPRGGSVCDALGVAASSSGRSSVLRERCHSSCVCAQRTELRPTLPACAPDAQDDEDRADRTSISTHSCIRRTPCAVLRTSVHRLHIGSPGRGRDHHGLRDPAAPARAGGSPAAACRMGRVSLIGQVAPASRVQASHVPYIGPPGARRCWSGAFWCNAFGSVGRVTPLGRRLALTDRCGGRRPSAGEQVADPLSDARDRVDAVRRAVADRLVTQVMRAPQEETDRGRERGIADLVHQAADPLR